MQSFYLAANTYLSGMVDSHNLKLPCTLYLNTVKEDTFMLVEPNRFPTLSSYTLRSTETQEVKIPSEWRHRLKGDLGIRFKVYSKQAGKVKVLVHFQVPRPDPQPASPAPNFPRRVQDFEWDEFLEFKIYRPKRRKKKAQTDITDHVQSNISEVSAFDKNAILSRAIACSQKADRQRSLVLAKKEHTYLTKRLTIFKDVLRREIKEEVEVERMNQSLQADIQTTFKKYMFNSFWTFMVLADIKNRIWQSKFAKVCLRSKARPGLHAFKRLLDVVRKKKAELAQLGQMRQTLKSVAALLQKKVQKKASQTIYIFLKEYFLADAARRSFLLYVARSKHFVTQSSTCSEKW